MALSLTPENEAEDTGGNLPLSQFAGQAGGSEQLSAEPASKESVETHQSTAVETKSKEPIDEVRAAFGEREGLNTLPPPNYHLRPSSEWQGMLVDTSMQSFCDGKSACGLAMACKNNLCGACLGDWECESGESCVLDHCVVSQNITCNSATDCGEGELCVLSGYSSDLRGNETMEAYCQATVSGSQPTIEQAIDSMDSDPGPYVLERPVSVDRLQEVLSNNGNVPVDASETRNDPSQRSPSKQFDVQAKEYEFEQHESFDATDPQEEHEVVKE